MIKHLTTLSCALLCSSFAFGSPAFAQAEKNAPAPAPPAAAAPAAPAPAAAAPAWKEFVFRDNGFAISGMAEPKLERRPIYVVGGTSEAFIYTAPVDDEAVFMVFVFERAAKDRRSDAKVRTDAAKDAVEAVNGKLKSRSTVALGRFRGVELDYDAEHPEFDMKKQRVRDRLYVVGRKLYHLMAIAPVGTKFPEETDKWFKSFRLTTADDEDDDDE
jgi:hypothetical protein